MTRGTGLFDLGLRPSGGQTTLLFPLLQAFKKDKKIHQGLWFFLKRPGKGRHARRAKIGGGLGDAGFQVINGSVPLRSEIRPEIKSSTPTRR
jgi:hypothetical protein